jgi:hypothetical protein
LLDRRAIEAPVAANPKAGQPSLPQQAINRRRMDAQMLRQFFNREDIVSGSRRRGRTVYFSHIKSPSSEDSCLHTTSVGCLNNEVNKLSSKKEAETKEECANKRKAGLRSVF